MLELVVPWVFLVLSLAGAAFTVNAFVPVRGSKWLLIPSFLASLFTAELAWYHLIWQALLAAGLVALGGLAAWPGWIALGLAGGSWVGLLALVVQGQRAAITVREALSDTLAIEPRHPIRWSRVLVPFPLRTSRTRVVRDIVYARVRGQRLRLDVYLPPPGARRPGPAIVQIHGGGWVVGDKRQQGVPLMTRLSDRGYVGFNVNYRLSPGATWPDHLVDVKRAIAWIREHADEYGVDPGFVAVTGGSAGGHIAAMVGLTGSDPQYQPGFEDADTSVQAVVPFYAIYDFTDRLGTHAPGYLDTLLEPLVVKAFFDEEPEAFSRASPVDNVHPDAPPFFVIHGNRDTLAPLPDARAFVARLRETSRERVIYAELEGAQHAFDVFVSPRSLPVIESVGDFLDHLVRKNYRLSGFAKSDSVDEAESGGP